jgi:hypothetical protein
MNIEIRVVTADGSQVRSWDLDTYDSEISKVFGDLIQRINLEVNLVQELAKIGHTYRGRDWYADL